MTKTSKFFIVAFVFLLFLNTAHAAFFEAKAVPIKDKIAVNEIAEYNITIQNNLDSDEEYTIKKTTLMLLHCHQQMQLCLFQLVCLLHLLMNQQMFLQQSQLQFPQTSQHYGLLP